MSCFGCGDNRNARGERLCVLHRRANSALHWDCNARSVMQKVGHARDAPSKGYAVWCVPWVIAGARDLAGYLRREGMEARPHVTKKPLQACLVRCPVPVAEHLDHRHWVWIRLDGPFRFIDTVLHDDLVRARLGGKVVDFTGRADRDDVRVSQDIRLQGFVVRRRHGIAPSPEPGRVDIMEVYERRCVRESCEASPDRPRFAVCDDHACPLSAGREACRLRHSR